MDKEIKPGFLIGAPPSYISVHPRIQGGFRVPSVARGRAPVSLQRDADGDEVLYEHEIPFEEL